MLSNRIRSINKSVWWWVCAFTVVLASLASVGHAQIFTLAVDNLYVGNLGTQRAPMPSIEVFNANGGLSWSTSLQTAGAPLAFAQGPTYTIFRRFSYGTLYVALSTGTVEHYEVTLRWGGGTALVGSHAVEQNPSAMIATATNLYVANRGSNSISVFSINPVDGGLTFLQTLTGVRSPGELALDPNQQVLVASSGGATFCTMQIQVAGDLSAPMCTQMSPAPVAAKILFVDSVLYMTVNSSTLPMNQLQGWRVDRTTGAFTQVAGSPISFGSWALYGLAKVPGVNAVYLARTGGVTQVTTASAGFRAVAGFNFTGVPASIYADPRGGRLFVTDTAQNQVFSLTVGPSGALSTGAVAIGVPGEKFPRGMSLVFQ
jgi:hypothetical protein